MNRGTAINVNCTPCCRVEVQHETDVDIGKMQTYSMEDQYESVNIGDFDVVRSTQFVDDLSRGVHGSLHYWFSS